MLSKDWGIFPKPFSLHQQALYIWRREIGLRREPGEKIQTKSLFQRDMKTEKRTEIRGSFLLSNIIKLSLAEIEKGIEVLSQRYADRMGGLTFSGLFLS